MAGGRMGLILSSRRFESGRGEDLGDEIADGCKGFCSIFHYAQTLTALLDATLLFSLQITY